MHARQRLRQVGVALVGDDDGRAGLGDQEVGAGDADVGGEEFRAQDAARFRDERRWARRIAVGRQRDVAARKSLGDVGRASGGSPARSMWLGVSPRIWMMYSPRSVSTTSSPSASRRALRPISSEIIDLLLVTTRAPASRQMPRTMSQASAAVDAQCTFDARRGGLALELLEVEVEMGERVVLDVATASRSASNSGKRCLRPRAPGDEAARDVGERPLQPLVRRAPWRSGS